MTARLQALCALIERTPSFIDVGCDHGYVTRYVYEHALADRICACDVSAASLRKARTLLEGADVTFVCGDGAAAAVGYDTVFVAGLGGDETCAIMENLRPRTYILSPHSHAEKVRGLLCAQGYEIDTDYVLEDGKFYDVLRARRGEAPVALTALQRKYGVYCRRPSAALARRLRQKERAISSYPPSRENEETLKEIREVLAWQSR